MSQNSAGLGLFTPDFIDRHVAGVCMQLKTSRSCATAQQLRQMLEENPNLRTLTAVRDFLLLDRPGKYCTPELDRVARLAIGWQIQYVEDLPTRMRERIGIRVGEQVQWLGPPLTTAPLQQSGPRKT